MKNITSIALAAAIALGSSAAFAGGVYEPEMTVEPAVAPAPAAQKVPLWLLLVGAVGAAALLNTSK